MILLDYFKTALKPSVLKLLVKVFVTALFPIKKQTLQIQRNIFELKNKTHTFKKREKDKYHEVPAVLLYSFHLAPQRENESCIDETSGGTQATLPASIWSTWATGAHFMIAHCLLLPHRGALYHQDWDWMANLWHNTAWWLSWWSFSRAISKYNLKIKIHNIIQTWNWKRNTCPDSVSCEHQRFLPCVSGILCDDFHQ